MLDWEQSLLEIEPVQHEVMQDPSYDEENGDLYKHLMAISQEAISKKHYETAYHALAAALHYAHDIGDEQRLLAVADAAKAQQDWIDAQEPTHQISRQAAVKRNGKSLYDMLAQQAATQARLVQHENCRKHAKHLPWPGDSAKT